MLSLLVVYMMLIIVPLPSDALMVGKLSITAALTPGACKFDILSSIDFGIINTNDYNKSKSVDKQTSISLPNKKIPFTITCQDQVLLAFSVNADHHPEVFSRIMDPDYSAALVDINGNNAGYYSMHLFDNKIYIDGKNPTHLAYSDNNGADWYYSPSSLLKTDDSELSSWSNDESSLLSSKVVNGELSLDAELYKHYLSKVTETTVVEGTTTFTLHYL